jgi:EAL domain-containing protein (putative c-di-GMP-specific phosphodiesterase class I)
VTNTHHRPAADAGANTAADVDAAVAGRGLTSVFQPIVSLRDGTVVGHEALARWRLPNPPTPDTVFATAMATGRLLDLERMCIEAAISRALDAGLAPGSTLFINCEATTPYLSRADSALLARGADRFELVFELTERTLLTHPAGLMRKVAALREDGFAIALDDVGAHADSLPLLDIVAPDVIKLDLALVQSPARYSEARAWAATLAHHERAGARVLAEGIESVEHTRRALGLGATLGQGFRYGRPGMLRRDRNTRAGRCFPARTQTPPESGSPFAALAAGVTTRKERKDTVLALARYLEQQALESADPPMVLTVLPRTCTFSAPSRERALALADASPLVAVFGSAVTDDMGHGVRGVTLDVDDPLTREWIVVILGATTAAALAAREHVADDDVHPCGRDRFFDVAVTSDRTLVSRVARMLLRRLACAAPNGDTPAVA